MAEKGEVMSDEQERVASSVTLDARRPGESASDQQDEHECAEPSGIKPASMRAADVANGECPDD